MDIKSYITGFVDGEGCFSISFSKREKMKLGLEIRPSFSVSQHQRSKDIILFLHNHFKCGGVRYSKRDQNFKFEVRSIADLVEKIIPHFERYPLMTDKKEQFERFAQICKLVRANQHLSVGGLAKIIALSDEVNQTGKKKYQRQDLLKMIAR
jgi:hypothetical protein